MMSEAFPPKIRSREVAHRNPYYEVHHVVADFGSFVKQYYIAEHGTRVGIVIRRGDEILLVRQYRFLINRLSLEIPGGKVDKGETPRTAAIRECLEETGLKCKALKPLITYLVGLDITNNKVHLFYTHQFTITSNTSTNQNEIETCVWVPINTCIRMVQSGEINDSFSIIALMSYKFLLDES